jgi:hypothetical protein
VREVARKREEPSVQTLVGEMDNELATGPLALGAMIEVATRSELNHDTTNTALIGRTPRWSPRDPDRREGHGSRGGGAFFRSVGLERLFRDVQGAPYHPLQEKSQLRYTGRFALGLDPDG